ncbi:Hydrophobin 2 [Mycena venus]|uniref:Hydrophobin n=1 Tax=Mycena venus TaxID=2733690 RepID=A0A8H7CSV3_9AGAR|nr:Hydrophobin 2 [Mycena venus]
MFSKLSIIVASVLITLAAAIPNGASAVAALLGIDLTGLNVPIGLSCSPITLIGNNCGSTTVTCDAPEKEWGGLIAINCIPITA